jgi:RNA-directed DNA polymerase
VRAKRASPKGIREGDIQSCVDKINHEGLLANIPTDTAILQKGLKAGYREQSTFYQTTEGTPQGGIISPVLANMTLDGLEQVLRKNYRAPDRQAKYGRNRLVNLVRYADDFIITGSSEELLEKAGKPLGVNFLRTRGLELSAEKTTTTPIEEGFDFRGQHVRKYDGKYLTRPSKKNVQTFLTDIRSVIKANKQTTAYGWIALLNPKIRGWANYHRHAASKETFTHVDAATFKALWRWACRRHPNKGRQGVRAKYFGLHGNQQWRFVGEKRDTQGKRMKHLLCLASATPIKRHAKIKGDGNPYDPAWEIYLEERLGVRMEQNLRGKRTMTYLWREQNGTCPVCNQPITARTGWHNHHIVYKTRGGTDNADNRLLVHPNGHRQLHAQGLSVSKPRPSRGD